MRSAFMRWVMPSSLAFVLAACGSDSVTGPDWTDPSDTVMAFVVSEGVPSVQVLDQIAVSNGVEAFQVYYGAPFDCDSGCARSHAFGLRLGDKVGWLVFSDREGFDPPESSFFDVEPVDSGLFNVALWDRLNSQALAPLWFWNGLMPLLARDPDTSSEALVQIAASLYSYISPRVAGDLLENPVVQQDEAVLTLLVYLPEYGGVYDQARAWAQELLSELQGELVVAEGAN